MAKLIFRQEAIDDLTDIWDYTTKKWTEEQADKYYGMIKTACKEIATESAIGRSYHEINIGLFGYRVGKHIIFTKIFQMTKLKLLEYCTNEWI